MRIDIKDGWLYFDERFLAAEVSDQLFLSLLSSVPWEQGTITLFGRKLAIPRREAFFAENGQTYGYSGQRLKTHAFTPLLSELKTKIEQVSGTQFNSVLLNLYQNGTHSNGWHADDEKELGNAPVIASLSVGSTRRFDLKHKHTTDKLTFELNSGSLLIMGGSLQHFWKHQIPKQPRITEPRINLTFRKIVDPFR